MGLSTLVSVASTFLIIAVLTPGNNCSPEEDKLIRKLLSKRYQKLGRPGKTNQTVAVAYGMVLQRIVNYDFESDTVTIEAWENLQWKDDRLTWKEAEAGGVRSLRLSPDVIWTPDITPYNGWVVRSRQTNIVVTSDGSALWVPPRFISYPCTFNETSLIAACDLKMGSWTYDGQSLNPTLSSDGADISSFFGGSRYKLIAAPAERNVVQYDCCPEEYIDIKFKIKIGFKKPRDLSFLQRL